MSVLVGLLIAAAVLYVLVNVLTLFVLMLENVWFRFFFSIGLLALIGGMYIL